MDKCQNCGKEIIAGMSLCYECQQYVRGLMAERRYSRHQNEKQETPERATNTVIVDDWADDGK